MQGIGGAMFEAIRFENGRILNPHFAEYRVPRFTDAPQIEVEFVERKDLPTAGAGETPLIGLAANRRGEEVCRLFPRGTLLRFATRAHRGYLLGFFFFPNTPLSASMAEFAFGFLVWKPDFN